MKFAAFSLACLLASVCVSTAAEARDIPPGGLTAAETVDWLQAAGYKAKLGKTPSGKPEIDTGADGHAFHIFFYDCKKDRCGSLEFSVGFDTGGKFNATKMNDWNLNNRWAHAYVDNVNDPWLQYDVDLTPGGTYELLDDQFGVWRDSLNHFAKYCHQ